MAAVQRSTYARNATPSSARTEATGYTSLFHEHLRRHSREARTSASYVRQTEGASCSRRPLTFNERRPHGPPAARGVQECRRARISRPAACSTASPWRRRRISLAAFAAPSNARKRFGSLASVASYSCSAPAHVFRLEQHFGEQFAGRREGTGRDGRLLRPIFRVGNLPHLGDAVGPVPASKRRPRRRAVTLDLGSAASSTPRSSAPCADAASRGDPPRLAPSRRRPTGPRRCARANSVSASAYGSGLGRRFELCRIGPRTPFERPPRRNRGDRIEGCRRRRRAADRRRIESARDLRQRIEQAFCAATSCAVCR